jgi:cell pole-organizing protein PopZ
MEDILASIRRILSEDEQPAPGAGSAPHAAEPEDDVLRLDESMLVAEPSAAIEPPSRADDSAALEEALASFGEPLEVAPAMPDPASEPPPPAPEPVAAQPPPEPPAIPMAAPMPDRLITPEAEAATASSLSTLMRTLESGRQAPSPQVYRGGPTLEDVVREEMRPLLKAWLDANLPPMVERLVRAEIERVVGRAVG